MKRKMSLFTFITLIAMLINANGTVAQEERLVSPASKLAATMGTYFTYQGRLQDDNGPVNNLCDFEFWMFASPGGSDEIWGPVPRHNVKVEDGYFTVNDLDFGAGTFQGEARYLEIGVRCPAGAGSYEKLSPRQELTAAPYALYARTAGNAWQLHGNSDTSPGLNFLGTSDNVALELHVNGQRALLLEPADSPNIIGGYSGNYVAAGVIGAFIGGGGEANKLNRVTDQWGTIAGGSDNHVNDSYATIGGGQGNSVDGIFGTIAGGVLNKITAGEDNTICGGGSNLIDGRYAVIAGGSNNIASGMNATIGGGGAANTNFSNHATGDYSTISGGVSNFATADYATIGGGGNNVSTDPTSGNLVSDEYGTVGGGGNNQAGDDAGASDDRPYATVSGGRDNVASGTASTVGGGDTNTASGWRSTVPGGVGNSAAGDHSFAAGRRAKTAAAADGSFVWSDSNDFDTMSWGPNEFVARATGGFWFISGINPTTGAITSGAWLQSGSNSWSVLSDRNSKTAFEQVDGRQVVARLAEIPIMTWQYISQPDDIRHIGPMAQDFYAAFGLGEDERYISTLDADGVSLAAIQGLYALSQERANQIQDLQSENETLRGQLDDLEDRVRLLETGAAPSSSSAYFPWAVTLLLGLGLIAVIATKRWTPGQEG